MIAKMLPLLLGVFAFLRMSGEVEGLSVAEVMNLRVEVELVGLPHAKLTELMGRKLEKGETLHGEVDRLVEEGTAKRMDTQVALARPGMRVTIQSIAELIYPTEMEPSGLGTPPKGGAKEGSIPEPVVYFRPGGSSAFETRNIGATMEMEATFDNGTGTVNLRMAAEWNKLLGVEVVTPHHDRWGDASVKFPLVESLKSVGSHTFAEGETKMVAVFAPEGDKSQRVLMFVRVDVMRPMKKEGGK